MEKSVFVYIPQEGLVECQVQQELSTTYVVTHEGKNFACTKAIEYRMGYKAHQVVPVVIDNQDIDLDFMSDIG